MLSKKAVIWNYRYKVFRIFKPDCVIMKVQADLINDQYGEWISWHFFKKEINDTCVHHKHVYMINVNGIIQKKSKKEELCATNIFGVITALNHASIIIQSSQLYIF